MPFVSIADSVEPCNKLDPMYHEAKRAIDLTKKFISDRGLICYGGTALDYAARLSGSKIYDDSKLDLPDLDFYSLDPVKDARDLADILFQNGFKHSRCIRALHIGTFRVDCGNNHFIADVSYCPVLATMKTLTYENFLVVDPVYQRIDMHSSLSFPYDNPPREVIFDRWKKDIERFNIIDSLYPVTVSTKTGSADKKLSEKQLKQQCVYAGEVAYNYYTTGSIFKDVNIIEICSMDPEETVAELGLTIKATYEQYFNLLPRMLFCTSNNTNNVSIKYIVYSTEDKMLSYETTQVAVGDGDTFIKYRVACSNYIMKILLGWSLVTKPDIDWPWRPDYVGQESSRYVKLLPVSRLSINVYGSDNIDHSTLMRLEEQANKMVGINNYETMYPLPENYRPTTGERKGEPFNYRSNPLLRINGIIEQE